MNKLNVDRCYMCWCAWSSSGVPGPPRAIQCVPRVADGGMSSPEDSLEYPIRGRGHWTMRRLGWGSQPRPVKIIAPKLRRYIVGLPPTSILQPH